jgi:FkbM family methyltransferase
MSVFSRSWYYATSTLTLLTGFDRPMMTMAVFLGWPGLLPAEVRLRRSGLRFKIRSAMDAWIIKETCLDQEYLWRLGRLEPGWDVVDIGAGLGDFTMLAATQCRDGVVHAYEPLPESHALLSHNVGLNQVENVRIFPAAVSSTGGSLAQEPAGNKEAVSTRFISTSGGENSVESVTLPAVVNALPDGKCDFMKIDCEGCEYDLLLSSSPDLLRRIDRISLEYHEDVFKNGGNKLEMHLERQGFAVSRRSNPVHAYLGLLYAQRT